MVIIKFNDYFFVLMLKTSSLLKVQKILKKMILSVYCLLAREK